MQAYIIALLLAVISCYSQLWTVVPWWPPPMEQWIHHLEPPSWWMLPIPVTLDTLWLAATPRLVGQTKRGLQRPPPVHVSSMSDCVHCIHCFHSTAVDCGSLTVTNGQVSTSSGTTFPNTATYTCDHGYNLNGTSDRTCQASGNWILTSPTCDRECLNAHYTQLTYFLMY